jgi:hypothetical protein
MAPTKGLPANLAAMSFSYTTWHRQTHART